MPALAVFVVAAALLLVGAVLVHVMDQVGRNMPNPSVPFTSFRPLGALIGRMVNIADRVRGWIFTGHFRVVSNAFDIHTRSWGAFHRSVVHSVQHVAKGVEHNSFRAIPKAREEAMRHADQRVFNEASARRSAVDAIHLRQAAMRAEVDALVDARGWRHVGGLEQELRSREAAVLSEAGRYTRGYVGSHTGAAGATTTVTLPNILDRAPATSIVIPLAAAGLASYVGTIASEIDQCLVSRCGGPNNLGNLLQDILGVADLTAVGSFLYEAVHDPAGEARAFAATASGAYHFGHAAFDALLSL